MHNESANVLDESIHSWLANMLVYSSDSLCGLAIDETIPKRSGWNDTPPPLFFEKRRRFKNKPSDHNWDAVVMLKEVRLFVDWPHETKKNKAVDVRVLFIGEYCFMTTCHCSIFLTTTTRKFLYPPCYCIFSPCSCVGQVFLQL